MLAQAPNSTMNILLVEDNPGDVVLTRTALSSERYDVRLHDVPDGEKAMMFLRKSGDYASAPRPHLILLDLNLPGVPGDAVLREIKTDGGLAVIPVIVLSSSGNPDDITRAYEGHANCYVRKPSEIGIFREVMQIIDRFWFATVELPAA